MIKYLIMSAGCLLICTSAPIFFLPQDLKPSNLAVNEDCELKVRKLIDSDLCVI